MQNYGKARNMSEPKLLEASDISNLIGKIKADKLLHNWQMKDFENSLIDETRPIYIIQNCGFIAFSKALDEAEILMIWISPEQRKNGLANVLLQFAFKDLKQRGTNQIFLEVAIDNIAALKLYNNHGFKEVGMRKNYYRSENNDNIDALILSKTLNNAT